MKHAISMHAIQRAAERVPSLRNMSVDEINDILIDSIVRGRWCQNRFGVRYIRSDVDGFPICLILADKVLKVATVLGGETPFIGRCGKNNGTANTNRERTPHETSGY